MWPLLDAKIERHLNGEKIEWLAGQVEARRETESFALVARSQLAADKALSCVSSRYLMQRWVFSAQSRGVL